MKIGYLGTDYQRSPLPILEKLYFSPQAIDALKARVTTQSPLQEWVILSTCNRVELYFTALDLEKGAQWLLSQWAEISKVSTQDLESALRYLTNQAAIEHLCRVVAGIESMVFGENEILAQVKDAHARAQKLGLTGPVLNKVFQIAITSGKRVRKETAIGRGAYSISSIAVDCMRQHYPDFNAAKILIIGAGTMSLRAIKKLHALKHPQLAITNRTETQLDRLCEKYQMRHIPFTEWSKELLYFDIILVATSSQAYVVDTYHFVARKNTKPMLMIDLSVPRNINPDLSNFPGVQVVSLEGLKQVADGNLDKRKQELAKIEAILEEELGQLTKWITYRKKL